MTLRKLSNKDRLEPGKQYLTEIVVKSHYIPKRAEEALPDAIHTWLQEINSRIEPWQAIVADKYAIEFNEKLGPDEYKYTIRVWYHIVETIPSHTAVGLVLEVAVSILIGAVLAFALTVLAVVSYEVVQRAPQAANSVMLLALAGGAALLAPREYRLPIALGAGGLAYLAWKGKI